MSWSMALSREIGRLLVRMPADPAPEALWTRVDPARRDARPPWRLRRRADVRRTILEGWPVWTVRPRGGGDDAPHVLYLHGGGYVHPLSWTHWRLVERVATGLGAVVHVPCYPLAPEHTNADAWGPLDAAYGHACAAAYASTSGRLVLMGDSAGGGLALALAQRARTAGRRAADALVLLAPWVDVGMTNPDAAALHARDISLRCGPLAEAGRAWAGDLPVTDPLISPLHADLAGLPPLTVQQGGCDVLAPDVRRFVAKARAAGVPVEMLEAPDAYHVYIGAWWTPEGRQAWRSLAATVRGSAQPSARG